MLYRLADRTNVQTRVRVVDIAAVVLWMVAIALLIVGTAVRGEGYLGRWGLLVGMLALAVTIWAIATWMIEVIRLEYEITKLRQLPPASRRRMRDGNGGTE